MVDAVVAVRRWIPRHLGPFAERYFGAEHRKRCGGVLQEEQSQHRMLPRHRVLLLQSAMLLGWGHSRASCEILPDELGSSANSKKYVSSEMSGMPLCALKGVQPKSKSC